MNQILNKFLHIIDAHRCAKIKCSDWLKISIDMTNQSALFRDIDSRANLSSCKSTRV